MRLALTAPPPLRERARPRPVLHLRPGAATAAAAVLGAAPHVLLHIGPLAGAALPAGASGKLLFGALGCTLAIPMLRRLHHRHGSWAVPGGLVALTAVAFTGSAVVLGPAITGTDSDSSR